MKITKGQLRRIIREEAQRLHEQKIKAQSHPLLKEQGEGALHVDDLELDGEGTDFADEIRQNRRRSDSGTLKKTVVPPSERGLTAKSKQNLDKQIAGYLSKGYKEVDALPQLPDLKTGLKASYAESDHLAIFKDFPIVIVFEKSICKRSCSPNRQWWVEEKEFKKLVGTDAGFANNKVYAVLAKEDLANLKEENVPIVGKDGKPLDTKKPFKHGGKSTKGAPLILRRGETRDDKERSDELTKGWTMLGDWGGNWIPSLRSLMNDSPEKQIEGYLSKGYKKVKVSPRLPLRSKSGKKPLVRIQGHVALVKAAPVVLIFKNTKWSTTGEGGKPKMLEAGKTSIHEFSFPPWTPEVGHGIGGNEIVAILTNV